MRARLPIQADPSPGPLDKSRLDFWTYLKLLYKSWVGLAAGFLSILAAVLQWLYPAFAGLILWTMLGVAAIIALVIAPYLAWQQERERAIELQKDSVKRQIATDLRESIGILLTHGNRLEDWLLTGLPVKVNLEEGEEEYVVGCINITKDLYGLPDRDYRDHKDLEDLNPMQRARLVEAFILEPPDRSVMAWIRQVTAFAEHSLDITDQALLFDSTAIPGLDNDLPEPFNKNIRLVRAKKYRLGQLLDRIK